MIREGDNLLMPRKKTHDEFISEILNIVGNEYSDVV